MSGLTDQLRAEYPGLYPPTLLDHHFSVPVGWAGILRRLSERLTDKQLTVLQVKEKFGGLRYYVEIGAAEDVGSAIGDAENQSWETCDVCGEYGELRATDSHWFMVRCDSHANGVSVFDPRQAASQTRPRLNMPSHNDNNKRKH